MKKAKHNKKMVLLLLLGFCLGRQSSRKKRAQFICLGWATKHPDYLSLPCAHHSATSSELFAFGGSGSCLDVMGLLSFWHCVICGASSMDTLMLT